MRWRSISATSSPGKLYSPLATPTDSRAAKTFRAQDQVLQVVGQRVSVPPAVSANVVRGRVNRHKTKLSFVKIVSIDTKVSLGEGQNTV